MGDYQSDTGYLLGRKSFDKIPHDRLVFQRCWAEIDAAANPHPGRPSLSAEKVNQSSLVLCPDEVCMIYLRISTMFGLLSAPWVVRGACVSCRVEE